jgi:hypothetical protein
MLVMTDWTGGMNEHGSSLLGVAKLRSPLYLYHT